MISLTPRTKINGYWTTDPKYLGYGNIIEKWNPLENRPDFTGTPKTVLQHWKEEKRCAGLNSGTYYAVRFYVGAEKIDINDIQDFVSAHEMKI
jgi:hypothetical protein